MAFWEADIGWVDPNCFSYRVREMRKSLGLTQKELGNLTGLNPAAISHMESGRREPRLTNIIKVCTALGCKIDKLIIIKR